MSSVWDRMAQIECSVGPFTWGLIAGLAIGAAMLLITAPEVQAVPVPEIPMQQAPPMQDTRICADGCSGPDHLTDPGGRAWVIYQCSGEAVFIAPLLPDHEAATDE